MQVITCQIHLVLQRRYYLQSVLRFFLPLEEKSRLKRIRRLERQATCYKAMLDYFRFQRDKSENGQIECQIPNIELEVEKWDPSANGCGCRDWNEYESSDDDPDTESVLEHDEDYHYLNDMQNQDLSP